MKQHHLLELVVAMGIIASASIAVILNQQAIQVNTTGNVLNVATSGRVETLNSTTYSSLTASSTIGATIVGLYDRDANGNIISAVSDGQPDISLDSKCYVFHLRPYHWSNGARVTVQDFVYAWQRLADPKTGARNAARIDFLKNGTAVRSGRKPVSALGVHAISKTRLEVDLQQANPFLDEILADTPLLPINQAFAQKWGHDYGSNATRVLANGPYQITDWSGANDTTWRYVKNPAYAHAKRVQVKTIDFTSEADTSIGAKAFAAGKFDYAALSPQQVPSFQGTSQLHTQRTTTEAFVFFNTTTGPTTNQALRQAIAQAFDKRAFTQSRLRDGSQPLNGLIPAGLTNMSEGQDYRATTGQLLPYNLSKATAAWARAKKQMGVNRLNLTLTIADNPTAKIAAAYFAGQVEHNLPGLHITVKKVSLTKRVALETAGKFELVFSTWSPADSDPMNLLSFYQTGSRLNITGYSNAKFDAMCKQVEDAGAYPAKRLALVQKAERYLICQQVPSVGFFQQGTAYLLDPSIKRFPVMPSGAINYEYVKTK
ncbi:peptide ABC transporter substrate-binding protein [Lacticaseibacillus sp. N501-2]|uniref:peptide ABC transporter substrate-binding protein n=1 Tax=Lacticaseibacillus salsurae TaxID=3367729 RepID=UPI0038B34932